MRKFGEYDFTKMSDSRLMFMQKPPKFTFIFVLIVIGILLALFIWSNAAVKAETVETTGVIVSVDKTLFTVETDGKVSAVNVKEGEYAKKGDILFSLDKTQLQN